MSLDGKIRKIIHLIPYDGIGGVEAAARSMGCVNNAKFTFQVNCVFNEVSSRQQRMATFNPLLFLKSARNILNEKADILIVSLWRSAIVGLLVKLFRPKLKLVVFIHLPIDIHWVDFILTRLAVRFSDELWADSYTSLNNRFPHYPKEKARVISFVTEQIKALPERAIGPDFIFWGRLNKQKGLEHALNIFAGVHKQTPSAKFRIIGPDGGVEEELKSLCNELDISNAVIFLGGKDFAEIRQYALISSFYLQASTFEGMAMSVVEAMQMGLLAVVTPVGEIGRYCRHGVNAVFVSSEQQAARDILELLDNNQKYQVLRTAAIATWLEKLLYRKSIVQACHSILLNKQ